MRESPAERRRIIIAQRTLRPSTHPQTDEHTTTTPSTVLATGARTAPTTTGRASTGAAMLAHLTTGPPRPAPPRPAPIHHVTADRVHSGAGSRAKLFQGRGGFEQAPQRHTRSILRSHTCRADP